MDSPSRCGDWPRAVPHTARATKLTVTQLSLRRGTKGEFQKVSSLTEGCSATLTPCGQRQRGVPDRVGRVDLDELLEDVARQPVGGGQSLGPDQAGGEQDQCEAEARARQKHRGRFCVTAVRGR